MSGLDLDLEAVARRLSFSLASPAPRSPRRRCALPPIAEEPGEQQVVETPARPSPCTSPPSQAPSCALYTVPDVRPVMTYAPVSPSLVHALIVPSVSPFQPQEAVAAAELRELERRCQVALVPQRQAWAEEAAQPQQLRLYTVEGNTAGYKTKWEELHPASQELLLRIEDKIKEYRHHGEQLDQCSRLYDPLVSNKSFQLSASQISQEIGLSSTMMDMEKYSVQSLMAVVKVMMWDTDFAMRSYVKLRPRLVHRGAGIANRAGSSGAPTDFNQPLTVAPTFHCYSGVARRPSPFMQRTVAKFEKQLEECCKLIGELEQLVQVKNDKTYSDSLKSLSKVMSNVHDYFIHVASKVENLHQYAETMRTQYLNDMRHRGDWSDPFLEADRKEAAKQEAAARRVHPTLDVPSVQPTAPFVVLVARCAIDQFEIIPFSLWRSDHGCPVLSIMDHSSAAITCGYL